MVDVATQNLSSNLFSNMEENFKCSFEFQAKNLN